MRTKNSIMPGAKKFLGCVAILGSLVGPVFANFSTTLVFDQDVCAQTDVTGAGGDPLATACVGFVTGNDNATMADWNSIRWDLAITSDNVVPTNYNGSEDSGLFGFADWLGDGNKAFKCDDCNNPVGDISLIYDEDAGTINMNLDSLAGISQFAVMMKQSTYWAAYLFPASADLPLEYEWTGATGPTNDLSHVSVIYRTGAVPPSGGEIPIPAPLALMGLGALMIAWRGRKAIC